MYKVHVALGKIVNALDESKPVADMRASTQSAAPSTTGDRQTTEERSVVEGSVIPEEKEEEDGEDEDEQTVMQDEQVTAVLKNEGNDSGDVTAMSDITAQG